MNTKETAGQIFENTDWNAVQREAAATLSEYIRIDTSNPPGNEMKAVSFFEEILRRERIPAGIYARSSDRGNIVATWKGRGERRALILLNHMDVVPVEPGEQWEQSPFSGVEKDGFIWGRGALDMKGSGIVQLIALLLLARRGISLSRDIIFCGTADEETGGAAGIEHVYEHSHEIAEAGCALNEGGGIRILDGRDSPCYWIAVSEKVALRIRLTCAGAGGHGSIYNKDNPNLKLINALQKLDSKEEPICLIPTVSSFFENMAKVSDESIREKFLIINESLKSGSFEESLRSNSHYDAMVRNTRVITILEAGRKVNVVPSKASACIDCRLIPGNSKEEFLRQLRDLFKEDDITIEIIDSGRESPESPTDTPLYRAIERVARRVDPRCIVTPYLMTGGSDSSYLRGKGIDTYGFIPFRLSQDEKRRVHGKNERLSVENLVFGIRTLLEIILELEKEG